MASDLEKAFPMTLQRPFRCLGKGISYVFPKALPMSFQKCLYLGKGLAYFLENALPTLAKALPMSWKNPCTEKETCSKVDMQHATAKLPSKLHLFACPDVTCHLVIIDWSWCKSQYSGNDHTSGTNTLNLFLSLEFNPFKTFLSLAQLAEQKKMLPGLIMDDQVKNILMIDKKIMKKLEDFSSQNFLDQVKRPLSPTPMQTIAATLRKTAIKIPNKKHNNCPGPSSNKQHNSHLTCYTNEYVATLEYIWKK
ncbi:hypothetical protein VP01_5830g1 [Puccinia sorghi]|uniref:Uncharacterized protein n=1 Tax=Puccinia sorghi TaxID=27349 RepID=A0A0L6UI34_9BASI|nr:hypothetical protein VP01_5830g1 [Puccinia sorghi]